MIPLRLQTRRFRGGYVLEGDTLRADVSQADDLVIARPNLEDAVFLRYINALTDEDLARVAGRFDDRPEINLPEFRKGMRSFSLEVSLSFDRREGPDGNGVDTAWPNAFLETVALMPVLIKTGGRPRVGLVATATLDFILMEWAMALEVGADLVVCRSCKKRFLVGPYTNRRADAKYCSDRCRVAAMRKRNAAKGVSNERSQTSMDDSKG